MNCNRNVFSWNICTRRSPADTFHYLTRILAATRPNRPLFLRSPPPHHYPECPIVIQYLSRKCLNHCQRRPANHSTSTLQRPKRRCSENHKKGFTVRNVAEKILTTSAPGLNNSSMMSSTQSKVLYFRQTIGLLFFTNFSVTVTYTFSVGLGCGMVMTPLPTIDNF